MLRKDTSLSRQGANLYNLLLCSFRTRMHTFFSLHHFRCNSNSNTQCEGGHSFWCSIFWVLFSVWWSEGSLFLPVVEMCVRGGGTYTLCWVYNQQILILRTRVELKCLSPELLFQGLNYKSNFSFKALIISRRPSQLLAASVCSHYSRGCVCWFMPLNWRRCHLAISLTVIMDGLFAADLFLSSAHLDSCWFCLVNNLTGYPRYFFLSIVPALISLSQITLRMRSGSFVFLLTEISLSLAWAEVQIRVLPQSRSELSRCRKEGWWYHLTPFRRLVLQPLIFKVRSPRLGYVWTAC